MVQNPLDRFNKYVSPEPNTGCHLWTGAVRRDGYGAFTIDKTMYGAHRALWLLLYGFIPSGAYVCHKCDIKVCVNPDHLYLGDSQTNMSDLRTRRRGHRTDASRWTRQSGSRWESRVSVLGREVYIGTFPTQEAAHKAAAFFVDCAKEVGL